MPLPKKIYSKRLARVRKSFLENANYLKKRLNELEKQNKALSKEEREHFKTSLKHLGLKGAKIDPNKINPKRMSQALNKITGIFLSEKSLLERTHYLKDFSKKRKSETRKEWLKRRRNAWKKFSEEQKQNKKVYEKAKKLIKKNPAKLKQMKNEMQMESRKAGDNAIRKLSRLGFDFNPVTGRFQISLTPLTIKNVKSLGWPEAFNRWHESVNRSYRAYSILEKAIEKQMNLLNRQQILYETVILRSNALPEKKARELKTKLKPTKKGLNFLLGISKTFTKGVYSALGLQ